VVQEDAEGRPEGGEKGLAGTAAPCLLPAGVPSIPGRQGEVPSRRSGSGRGVSARCTVHGAWRTPSVPGLAAVLLPGDCLLLVSLPDTSECLWPGAGDHRSPGNTAYPARHPCPWPPPQHRDPSLRHAAPALCGRLGSGSGRSPSPQGCGVTGGGRTPARGERSHELPGLKTLAGLAAGAAGSHPGVAWDGAGLGWFPVVV